MEISTYLNYCITHGCWQPNLIRTWWNALTVDQESKWYRFCRGWCASNLSNLWINENPQKFQKMEISTYLNYCITHGCWQPNLIRTWWNALTVDQESKWYRFCRGWCASNLSPLDKLEPPKISEDGNFYLLELLYYSWMLTAEFDNDLVKCSNHWSRIQISEDGNFYLLELLYYSWMLTAEFDKDLVKCSNCWSRIQMVQIL